MSKTSPTQEFLSAFNQTGVALVATLPKNRTITAGGWNVRKNGWNWLHVWPRGHLRPAGGPAYFGYFPVNASFQFDSQKGVAAAEALVTNATAFLAQANVLAAPIRSAVEGAGSHLSGDRGGLAS